MSDRAPDEPASPPNRDEPVGGLMIGIDVGGTSIKAALVDQRGRFVRTGTPLPTRDGDRPPTVGSVVDKILEVARDLMRTAKTEFDGTPVMGAGLVVPGIIDEDRGVAYDALQLRWEGTPLGERISDALGLPTWLDHDVRSAGLAEGLWGAAAGLHDYMMVAIGTGVGAALVIEGKPYRRPGGVGSEFGHTTVNFGPDGEPCGCNRIGCVEAYASGRAIAQRYEAMNGSSARSISAKEVLEGARSGKDPLATKVSREACEALAAGIMNCIVLFSPELILIGGGVAEGNPWMVEDIARALISPNFMSYLQRDAPPVELPKYRHQAGIAGAAASAWLRSGVPRRRLARP